MGPAAPLLTVAIPTYQRPKRLSELLEALATQQGLNAEQWEIVVSDNCSADDTGDVVRSFGERMPNLRYFRNDTNIGADRNIRGLPDKAAGRYVWILPDDDLVRDQHTLTALIDRIVACRPSPAFVIANAASVSLDTGAPLHERFTPLRGDAFFTDGRDMLTAVSDFDLIGAQRLILRRDTLPDPFADSYAGTPVACAAMALAAAARGPTLVVGEPLAVFRDGDQSAWRRNWPSIYFQLLPELLLDATRRLGYRRDAVDAILRQRSLWDFPRQMPERYLILQRYGVSWARLARLYGRAFVLRQLARAGLRVPMVAIRHVGRRVFGR